MDVAVETAHSDDWEESGKKIFQERASDSVKQILREYEKPDIDTEIEQALSPYVLKGKKEAK